MSHFIYNSNYEYNTIPGECSVPAMNEFLQLDSIYYPYTQPYQFVHILEDQDDILYPTKYTPSASTDCIPLSYIQSEQEDQQLVQDDTVSRYTTPELGCGDYMAYSSYLNMCNNDSLINSQFTPCSTAYSDMSDTIYAGSQSHSPCFMADLLSLPEDDLYNPMNDDPTNYIISPLINITSVSAENKRKDSSKKIKKRKPAPSAEKKFVCSICNHRSKRKHNLNEHMLTHDSNRPKKFSCTHCARPFARKYDQKRHEKIHSR
ncbi:hypothetical protein BDB01DRAFT_780733 [Pilobolus umbonatus]|nr:hypothetical protein BDB01DRAFT_780733 [Pilobolus umbonatus]